MRHQIFLFNEFRIIAPNRVWAFNNSAYSSFDPVKFVHKTETIEKKKEKRKKKKEAFVTTTTETETRKKK